VSPVNISLVGFVLFLHVAVVIVSFMMAAVLHAALHVLPRAQSVAEMRPWARLIHRLDPLLPVGALFILVFGAWLVHLEKADGVTFSSGWVITSIVTLIVVEGLAGALLAPRAKALVAAVDAAPEGTPSPDLRRMTVNPFVWNVSHVATFGFLALVFDMTDKPSGSVAWLFPTVGVALGLALAAAQRRAATARQPSAPVSATGSPA
jgi:hypothetical protein